MAFTVKNWEDSPAVTTPLSAAAIEDLETRVTDYAEVVGLGIAANIENYGADPTGASDSAAAFTAAGAASNQVLVGAGTFVVESTVTLPSQTTFWGQGEKSVIQSGDAAASPVVTFARGNSSSLRNLHIDAADTSGVAVGIEGFNDGQIQHPSIYDCQISGASTAGLRFLGGYRGLFVNNEIFDNEIGVQIPAASSTYLDSLGQFTFLGGWMHDNNAQGVLLNGGGPINFHGLNIENNGGHGAEIQGLEGRYVYPVSFNDVQFEANGGNASGIGLWSRDSVRSLSIIGGSFVSSSLQSKGFTIESGTGSATILNPSIEGHGTKSTCAAPGSFVVCGYVSGVTDTGITVTGTESLYYSPEVDGWVDLSGIPQIAANTTITVPQGVKLAEITGSTTIDNITYTRDGHHITLKFTSTPDVRHGVGNIYLSGAGTFSATANDMLTLVYYDGAWRETARTVI